MRLITVPGYSLTTKKKIVKNMVLKSYAERLKVNNVSITDTALDLLMREYSVASGIRDVEKDIEKLLVRLIKKYNKYSDFCITEDIIREVLGSKRTLGLSDMGNKAAVPGQAMALGVSGYIGSCIAVQVTEDPYQKAEVEVSGLLKDACIYNLHCFFHKIRVNNPKTISSTPVKTIVYPMIKAILWIFPLPLYK